MTEWQPIETAPKDAMIIGAYFNQPWSESHRNGRIVQCWWQPEFAAFISSCREMTMAPGYTIDGQTRKLHSEVREDVTHWIPLPSTPAIADRNPEGGDEGSVHEGAGRKASPDTSSHSHPSPPETT